MDTSFHVEDKVFNYRVAGVWIENGHILLHKQTNDLHWALPGGRAKILEDSKACLLREMKEELAVDVTAERLLWVAENFFSYNSKSFHELGFYHLVHSAKGELNYRPEPFFGPEGEHLTYQWVALDKLEEVNLYPAFLRQALQNLPETTEHLIVSDYQMKI